VHPLDGSIPRSMIDEAAFILYPVFLNIGGSPKTRKHYDIILVNLTSILNANLDIWLLPLHKWVLYLYYYL